MKWSLFAAALVLSLTSAPVSLAQAPASPAAHPEPGWLGVVIARGELREQIEATPILDRPYRPLHIYGNTVRRSYYRTSAVPRPRDVVSGAGALVGTR